MDILEVLKELDIEYELQEHKAVYTVDDLQDVFLEMEGIGCKNLFLKDAKKNLFLYTLPDNKRAYLKTLPEKINSKRLSFANENDLQEYLGLTPGSVTPLGIINDNEQKVTVVLDKGLKNNKVFKTWLIKILISKCNNIYNKKKKYNISIDEQSTGY